MSSGAIRGGSALIAVILAVGGCSGLHHSRGWKLADLDRNWLNEQTFRGMSDARSLADGMPHPDAVLSANGVAERSIKDEDQKHPLEIVVRYDGSEEGFQDIPDECFRFTFPDGYDVAFDDVDCPD
jgi:hypothetical protein